MRTCHVRLRPLIQHGELIWVILHPVPERLVKEECHVSSRRKYWSRYEECAQELLDSLSAEEPFEGNAEPGAGERVPFPDC